MDTVDLKLSLNLKHHLLKYYLRMKAAPGAILVFLSVCLPAAVLLMAPASPAQGGGSAVSSTTPAPSPVQMQELEKELFFTTFDDDTIEDRLTRLENKVFGTTRDGAIDQRIQALQNVVLKARKSGSLSDGYQSPAPPLKFQPGAGSQQQQQQFPAPGTESTAPAGKPATVFADENAQQRLAIQAAREAEINAVMQEGIQLFRAKKYDQARSRFEQVLRLDPANAQANYSLGIILEASGQLTEARTAYMAAYATNPNNADFRDAVAAIEQKCRQLEQKNMATSRSRELNESALEAFKRGDYYSAIDMYKQLDMLEPNQALIKYNMGTIYLMMKEPDNALLNFKAAYTLKPDDSRFEKSFKELDKQIKKAGISSTGQAAMQNAGQQQVRAGQAAPYQQQMQNMGQQQMPVGQVPYQQQMQNMGQQQMPAGQVPYQQQMQNMGQQQMPVGQAAPYQQQMQNAGSQQMPAGQVPYGYNQSGVPPVFQNSSLQQKRQDLMFQYGIVGKAASDGVQVTNVLPGSRAARAGVAAGDLIRAVGSEEVYEPWQVNRVLQRIPYRQDIPVLFQRNGELRTANM